MLHKVWNRPVGAAGEEGDWWASLMDRFMDAYHAAEKDGSLGRGGVARRMGISPETIILDEVDMKLARQQAAASGITYQQHIRNLVHAGVAATEENAVAQLNAAAAAAMLEQDVLAHDARLAEDAQFAEDAGQAEDALGSKWLLNHFARGERVTS